MKNHSKHNLNPAELSYGSCPVEDPWDGAKPGIQSSQARSMSFWDRYRPLFITAIALTLSLLLLAGYGHSQNAPRSDNNRLSAKMKMDKETRKLAEEYVYLLEQLVFLSTDYCRYFEKLDDEDAAQNYKSLKNLCISISKSGYYDNLEELVLEIEELRGELTLRKASLTRARKKNALLNGDTKRTKESMKALRLTSSLLTELAALEEQLEEEVLSKTATDKSRRRVIQQYVVTFMQDSIAKMAEIVALVNVPEIKVTTGRNGRGTQIYIESDLSAPVVVTIPEVPKIIATVEPPQTPAHPRITNWTPRDHTQETHYVHSGNSTSFVKTFQGSISTSSGESEIMIINPFGKMTLTGWDKQHVSATYKISIVSVNPEVAEKFIKKIQLRMFEEKDDVYIEAVVPRLTDPRTRIAESHLNLMVPFNNDLKISNSSGQIELSDLENNIKIKSYNSFINMLRNTGDVEIINSGGNIELERVTGNILVQNRMGGSVSIISSSGRIEVDNSHAPIEIDHCNGNLTIRNSGKVEVNYHTGTVHVNNRNGFVSASHIEGDLVVFNSFEPLEVYNVTGAVRLESANSVIEAENIEGSLDISNRYGKIFTSYIAGPINIMSNNGDVFMEMLERLKGNSSVVANGGRVILGLSQRIDLLLTMETQDGVIDVTDFRTTASSDSNGLQTAKLELGKATNLLAVKGSRSKIIVKEID